MSEHPVLKSLEDYRNNTEKKLLCMEVNPPRGVDLTKVFKRLDKYSVQADFFNVTDSALARMRMSPAGFAVKLKERYGIEPLINVSCRDRNSIALQADLLSGAMQGIESVICLTGDAVSVGDNQQAKGVFEMNSVGLLGVVECLNAGKDLAGNVLEGAPGIVPGVVVNPNAKNPDAEIRKLERKISAGAKYALSQPVFDADLAVSFFEKLKALDFPVLIGLMALKNSKAAISIENVPGIRLSEQLLKSAQADPDQDLRSESIELCAEIADAVKPYVSGYHVVCGTTPVLACQLLKRLNQITK